MRHSSPSVDPSPRPRSSRSRDVVQRAASAGRPVARIGTGPSEIFMKRTRKDHARTCGGSWENMSSLLLSIVRRDKAECMRACTSLTCASGHLAVARVVQQRNAPEPSSSP
ncbi:hypothetical protein CF319_g4163 [Tilletia indica]|uniref:Uncharacterized protein n=1 Tax=Tilletia indica TaxID=43049 RepID=A0A177TGU4_9BASI|nr:hypothetical protein CF319_g4163 [Tilletia indica]KAE8257476.1 hypothetical protein A4X13_0g2331 [Tilletia indica]